MKEGAERLLRGECICVDFAIIIFPETETAIDAATAHPQRSRAQWLIIPRGVQQGSPPPWNAPHGAQPHFHRSAGATASRGRSSKTSRWCGAPGLPEGRGHPPWAEGTPPLVGVPASRPAGGPPEPFPPIRGTCLIPTDALTRESRKGSRTS